MDFINIGFNSKIEIVLYVIEVNLRKEHKIENEKV